MRSVFPCSLTQAGHQARWQFLHRLMRQACLTAVEHLSQTSLPVLFVTFVDWKSCPPSWSSSPGSIWTSLGATWWLWMWSVLLPRGDPLLLAIKRRCISLAAGSAHGTAIEMQVAELPDGLLASTPAMDRTCSLGYPRLSPTIIVSFRRAFTRVAECGIKCHGATWSPGESRREVCVHRPNLRNLINAPDGWLTVRELRR